MLSQIVDGTNHVLTANVLGASVGRDDIVLRVGWRDASTFVGFCAEHDAALFEPIEREPFTGTPQQTFLVGYRSLCLEVFAKDRSAAGLARALDLADRGRPEEHQRTIQERLGTFRAGVLRGFNDNQLYKTEADAIIRAGSYNSWGSAVFEIGGPLSIASAGSATPSYDLSGARIQNLADFERRGQVLMFGMVPGARGTNANFVVFSWPPNSDGIEALVGSIVSLQDEEKGDVLARFMCAHVENTFLSPSWWEALSDLQKAEVLRLSALIDPEDERFIRGRPRIVDWSVVRSTVRHAGA